MDRLRLATVRTSPATTAVCNVWDSMQTKASWLSHQTTPYVKVPTLLKDSVSETMPNCSEWLTEWRKGPVAWKVHFVALLEKKIPIFSLPKPPPRTLMRAALIWSCRLKYQTKKTPRIVRWSRGTSSACGRWWRRRSVLKASVTSQTRFSSTMARVHGVNPRLQQPQLLNRKQSSSKSSRETTAGRASQWRKGLK